MWIHIAREFCGEEYPLSITNCAVCGREADFFLVQIEPANIDFLALQRSDVSKRAIGKVHDLFQRALSRLVLAAIISC